MFHGSYDPQDATFLMEPIVIENAQLDQNPATLPGGVDYVTQVASEQDGTDTHYRELFMQALARHKHTLAREAAQVARYLSARSGPEVVLVSLVRAGTPTGVVLHRALDLLGRRNIHYSISCTRKRGTDPSSLDYIRARHREQDIVFVDGWTGKGFIARELAEAVASYNATRSANVKPELVVFADLAGVSSVAASADDYLNPAAMLRSTVCGLISASMLNPRGAQSDLPDACLYYKYLEPYDCSRMFVDAVAAELPECLANCQAAFWHDEERRQAQLVSQDFVRRLMQEYDIQDINHVKPGICEANRALLTRNAGMTLFVRNPLDDVDDLSNLHLLAERKGVKVVCKFDMPYRAAVILKAV